MSEPAPARPLRGLWHSLGPWGRTIAWCLAAELIAVLVMSVGVRWLLAGDLGQSLLLGLAVSIGTLGPVSLWLGPALLARERRAQRRHPFASV
ncbi:hypothetical protein QRD43_18220 [Pelomonas sp. APW6]|uniref:Uncharacterized protein n=1 Tax=Roseateles subflavus TaxID=3053353 RepID=A0ABT7LNL8_9BURK|nr:hypothetical protein [Pelomonas sp. APW6]MDL5033852.1 hypothetical protein [Pelomonas sp. APW6]